MNPIRYAVCLGVDHDGRRICALQAAPFATRALAEAWAEAMIGREASDLLDSSPSEQSDLEIAEMDLGQGIIRGWTIEAYEDGFDTVATWNSAS